MSTGLAIVLYKLITHYHRLQPRSILRTLETIWDLGDQGLVVSCCSLLWDLWDCETPVLVYLLTLTLQIFFILHFYTIFRSFVMPILLSSKKKMDIWKLMKMMKIIYIYYIWRWWKWKCLVKVVQASFWASSLILVIYSSWVGIRPTTYKKFSEIKW